MVKKQIVRGLILYSHLVGIISIKPFLAKLFVVVAFVRPGTRIRLKHTSETISFLNYSLICSWASIFYEENWSVFIEDILT